MHPAWVLHTALCGLLDFREFESALNKLNIKLRGRQIKKLWSTLDADKYGTPVTAMAQCRTNTSLLLHVAAHSILFRVTSQIPSPWLVSIAQVRDII